MGGGGGIVFTQIVAAALESQALLGAIQTIPVTLPRSNGPWRPPQWAQPILTSISVPASVNDNPATLVFDAIYESHHVQDIKMTEHPVQTGANLSDHAYVLPSILTMEIGMSDAMDRYEASLWTGSTSKSVSAYQTLRELALLRAPLTITTRLFTYTYMLIESISVPDTYRTRYGLRATVTFRQIFMAKLGIVAGASARPQTTDSTALGAVQPTTPDPGIIEQHQVPPDSYGASVPGAGDYDSNSKYTIRTGTSVGVMVPGQPPQ